MIKSFKDLTVWQKSIDLCILVYRITDEFPKSEIYGLVSQMRRSVVAIASNIAEGQSRGHKQEYIQFLRIAYGSASELQTQAIIALKVDYLKQGDFDQIDSLLGEVLRMLNKLLSVLSVSK